MKKIFLAVAVIVVATTQANASVWQIKKSFGLELVSYYKGDYDATYDKPAVGLGVNFLRDRFFGDVKAKINSETKKSINADSSYIFLKDENNDWAYSAGGGIGIFENDVKHFIKGSLIVRAGQIEARIFPEGKFTNRPSGDLTFWFYF